MEDPLNRLIVFIVFLAIFGTLLAAGSYTLNRPTFEASVQAPMNSDNYPDFSNTDIQQCSQQCAVSFQDCVNSGLPNCQEDFDACYASCHLPPG